MKDDRRNLEIVEKGLMNRTLTIQTFQNLDGIEFQAIRFLELYEEVKGSYSKIDPEKTLILDCDLVILNNDKDFVGNLYPEDKPDQEVDEAELLRKFSDGRAQIKIKQDNHSFGWSYPVIVIKTPLTEKDFDWFDDIATKHEAEVLSE